MRKNITSKGIALAGVLAIGTACAGVRKTTTDLNPSINRPATCGAAIAVYNSRADVPYDYYELAWIQAEGNSVWTTDNQLQTQIRNGAAKVGANAVIVNPVVQAKSTVKILGEAIGSSSATQKASALAIWMPGDAARVRQACGSA
jgi:opacity protein-like surface antigen